MNNLCDLHTHSTASDGSYTPEQLVDAAIDLKLSAIALTDHNTIAGLPDFIASASQKPIEAICGAEFSVEYNGNELHLLGLFIESIYFSQITNFMQDAWARKDESNKRLILSLKKAGYSIDYDAIKRKHATGNVNRSHIADALIEAGFVESKDIAFATLLNKNGGHYIPPKRLTILEMIDFLKSIHAVPVLAHPLLQLNGEELTELLPLAKKQGLIGMECYHSDYDKPKTHLALKLTQDFDLLPSGGSDFHGDGKSNIYLGKGKNNLAIPYQWATNLKEAR